MASPVSSFPALLLGWGAMELRVLLGSLPKASVKALIADHTSKNCTLENITMRYHKRPHPQKVTPM